MGTKVGEVRESLLDAIELVKAGKLDPDSAHAIAKLAAQISLSLQVEANIRAQGIPGTGFKLPMGHMTIGHEVEVLEGQ
jgi:hypothetical protein